MAKRNNNARVAAEICLYGSREHGFDWLAATESEILGPRPDGMPRPEYPTATDAVFAAATKLTDAGYRGYAWVYEPRGELRALVDVSYPCYYGDLKWE